MPVCLQLYYNYGCVSIIRITILYLYLGLSLLIPVLGDLAGDDVVQNEILVDADLGIKLFERRHF